MKRTEKKKNTCNILCRKYYEDDTVKGANRTELFEDRK